ncbi:MAG TPA: hypothetical protein VE035_16260 [Puia sp.]|nr:hypothetical protein [Puia sp.]
MFPGKKYHINLGCKLLLSAVYFFLFTVQGDCRPDVAASTEDPSSLAYGVEHLPVYKDGTHKKIAHSPDKRYRSQYIFIAGSIQELPDPAFLVIGRKLCFPDPAPLSPDRLLAAPRGPPCV